MMDTVFKALADPNRRKLLDLLYANNGQSLTQLCEEMEIVRQSVTKHLALLEEANLVTTFWYGRDKLQYVNPCSIQEIYERWIRKFERSRLRDLGLLKESLEKGNQ